MRHVRTRILGLGLLVALVVSAIAAGSALASKDPYTVNTWGQYKACPWELYGPPEEPTGEITDCFYGRTNGGAQGGEFKYGHVSVKLNKPIIIQGGFKGSGAEIEVIPATHGFQTLESGDETIVKGLNVITPKIQELAEWPAALKESFAAAKAAKETKATLKVEMAGTECFTVPGCLSTENLLLESGPAFRLQLKVTIKSAWLETLGGGPCQIGSDENPIRHNLTAEGAGRAGVLSFNEEFTNLELHDSELVNVHWHIEPASGPHGCGGPEYESYVDKALELALEMQYASKSGLTWLTGDLHDASASVVAPKGEKGEL